MLKVFAAILACSAASLKITSAQDASTGRNTARKVAIYAPRPTYLREWAEKGITGSGLVSLSVDPKTGTVTEAHMIKSTGHRVLDDSALQGFRRWRFKPGTRKVKIPIDFINYPFEKWFIQKHGYPPPKRPKT
jgi:TonB family protein